MTIFKSMEFAFHGIFFTFFSMLGDNFWSGKSTALWFFAAKAYVLFFIFQSAVLLGYPNGDGIHIK